MEDTEIISLLKGPVEKKKKAIVFLYQNPRWQKTARLIANKWGLKTDVDVEEVFQKSLMACIDNVCRDKYRRESNLHTYFENICRFKAIDLYKKTAQNTELKITSLFQADIYGRDESALNLRNQETIALIELICKKVGGRCEKIIHFKGRGFSYDTISSILKIPRNRVAGAVYDCVKKAISLCKEDATLITKIREYNE